MNSAQMGQIKYLNNASRGLRSAQVTARIHQSLERELSVGQAQAEQEIADELVLGGINDPSIYEAKGLPV